MRTKKTTPNMVEKIRPPPPSGSGCVCVSPSKSPNRTQRGQTGVGPGHGPAGLGSGASGYSLSSGYPPGYPLGHSYGYSSSGYLSGYLSECSSDFSLGCSPVEPTKEWGVLVTSTRQNFCQIVFSNTVFQKSHRVLSFPISSTGQISWYLTGDLTL